MRNQSIYFVGMAKDGDPEENGRKIFAYYPEEAAEEAAEIYADESDENARHGKSLEIAVKAEGGEIEFFKVYCSIEVTYSASKLNKSPMPK